MTQKTGTASLPPAEMLAKAISMAAQIHERQKDKGGAPYILHPMRLAMRLRTTDYELMAIAMLHDAVEDGEELSAKKLLHYGMSPRVVDAVMLLTHDPEVEYMDYIRRIGTNPDATLVKIEDLRDNSDITRLKGLSEKDVKRLHKYMIAYTYLTGLAKLTRIVMHGDTHAAEYTGNAVWPANKQA